MDKFWNWMEENGFGLKLDSGKIMLKDNDRSYNKNATMQMLIGYMIEYCISKRIIFSIAEDLPGTMQETYYLLVKSIENN